MHYQSEEDDAYECKIFFAVREDTKDGFNVLNCDHPLPSFCDNFTAVNSAWVLNSAEQTTAFFHNALSLFAPESFESDDSENASFSPSKIVHQKPSKRSNSLENSETLESTLDRQFRFLARTVSADVWKTCVSSIIIRFPQYQVRTSAPLL